MGEWINGSEFSWALTGPTGASVYVQQRDEDEVFWEGYATDINGPEASGAENAVAGETVETVEEAKAAAEAWLQQQQFPTIQAVADLIDPAKAQLAIARAMIAMGCEQEWDSETIEHVANAVSPAFPGGVPSVFEQDDAAAEFWSNLA